MTALGLLFAIDLKSVTVRSWPIVTIHFVPEIISDSCRSNRLYLEKVHRPHPTRWQLSTLILRFPKPAIRRVTQMKASVAILIWLPWTHTFQGRTRKSYDLIFVFIS
jgi:hypothetical protein